MTWKSRQADVDTCRMKGKHKVVKTQPPSLQNLCLTLLTGIFSTCFLWHISLFSPYCALSHTTFTAHRCNNTHIYSSIHICINTSLTIKARPKVESFKCCIALISVSEGRVSQFHQGPAAAEWGHVVCLWDKCFQPLLSDLQGKYGSRTQTTSSISLSSFVLLYAENVERNTG